MKKNHKNILIILSILLILAAVTIKFNENKKTDNPISLNWANIDMNILNDIEEEPISYEEIEEIIETEEFIDTSTIDEVINHEDSSLNPDNALVIENDESEEQKEASHFDKNKYAIWKINANANQQLLFQMNYHSQNDGKVALVIKENDVVLKILSTSFVNTEGENYLLNLGRYGVDENKELIIEFYLFEGDSLNVNDISFYCNEVEIDGLQLTLNANNLAYTSRSINSNQLTLSENNDFLVWKLNLDEFDAILLKVLLNNDNQSNIIFTLFDNKGNRIIETHINDLTTVDKSNYLIAKNSLKNTYFLKAQKIDGDLFESDNITLDLINANIASAGIHIIDGEINPQINSISIEKEQTITLEAQFSPHFDAATVQWEIEEEAVAMTIIDKFTIQITGKKSGITTIAAHVNYEDQMLKTSINLTVQESSATVNFHIIQTDIMDELLASPDHFNVIEVINNNYHSIDSYRLIARSDLTTWKLPIGNYLYYFKGEQLGYTNHYDTFGVGEIDDHMTISIDLKDVAKDIESIVQDKETGYLSLMASDAKIYTPKAVKNLNLKDAALTGWIDTREYPYWRVLFDKPGTYIIKVKVAAQGVGGTFDLQFNDEKILSEIPVPITKGGWQSFEEIILGTITIEQIGVTEVRLIRNYPENPLRDFYTAPNLYSVEFILQ